MNKRQMKRARFKEMSKAAKYNAKLNGCTCDVQVSLSMTDKPLLFQGDCYHDEWCPLIRARNAGSN